MPRRAYSYLRYSSWLQRKGDSYRRQMEWAPRVCGERGWLLDEEATIRDEATSAFDGTNRLKGALAAFLQDVKRGIVPRGSVLLVESLDRLTREDLDEAEQLVKGLLRAGISIMTREPERFYDADVKRTLMHHLEIAMILERGHEESAVKSMRLKSRWQEKRRSAREERKPRGRRVPGWFDLVGGRYQLRPERAETIRYIFRMTCEGCGLPRLLALLHTQREVFPPWGRSGKWQVSYLRQVLHGREVLGEYQPKVKIQPGKYQADGPPIVGYYPAVIDEQTWLCAQAAVQARNGRSGRPAKGTPSLFTGIVYHARTRDRVSLQYVGYGKGRPKYRYIGIRQDAASDHGRDDDRHWRYDFFEQGILEAVRELQVRDVLPPGAEVDAKEQQLAQLTHRLVALDQRAEMLQKKIADPAATAGEAEANHSILRAVLAQKEEAAKENARLKMESDAGRGEALTQTQTLIQLWREAKGTDEEGPLAERIRAGLRRVVQEIWVLPQRLSRKKMTLHVQLYLRGGQRRYVLILPPKPPRGFAAPWLGAADFRNGDVSGMTPDAIASK